MEWQEGDVTVTLDIAEQLDDLNSSRSITDPIGEAVCEEILRMIAAGVSPVTGDRFEAYKAVAAVRAQRRKDKSVTSGKGYPYSVQNKYPDKTITPVNLYLSGEMLSCLTFDNVGGKLRIGIMGASEKVNVIAEAHNEGPTNDRFPQRRFIPTIDGEEFTISIMNKIIDLYTDALNDILEKSK